MRDTQSAVVVTKATHPEIWAELLEHVGEAADSTTFSDMEGKEVILLEPDQGIIDDYEALRKQELGAIITDFGYNPEKNKTGWAWVELALFSDTEKKFGSTLKYEVAKQIGTVVPFNDLPAGTVYPVSNEDGVVMPKVCIRTTKAIRKLGNENYTMDEWEVRRTWDATAADKAISIATKNASKKAKQAVARSLNTGAIVVGGQSIESIMAQHGLVWRDDAAKEAVLEELHN